MNTTTAMLILGVIVAAIIIVLGIMIVRRTMKKIPDYRLYRNRNKHVQFLIQIIVRLLIGMFLIIFPITTIIEILLHYWPLF